MGRVNRDGEGWVKRVDFPLVFGEIRVFWWWVFFGSFLFESSGLKSSFRQLQWDAVPTSSLLPLHLPL